MGVSVVIPAHNEEREIEGTLRAVWQQTVLPEEVIVVCNDCTDHTAKIAKRYATKVIEMRERGVSLARNMGAKAATSDILLFVDADTRLAPTVVREVLRVAERRPRLVGCVTSMPDNHRYSWYYAFMNLIVKRLKIAVNGMIFCQRNLFESVGGFPEDVTFGEDYVLMRKMQRRARCRYVYLQHTYGVASTRRLEKVGVVKYTLSVLGWLFVMDKSKLDYEVVR